MGHQYHPMKRGGGIVHVHGNNNGMGIISSARAVKMAMGILGMCVVGYIAGPPLYWHFVEGVNAYHRSSSSCPPCFCDCSSSFPFFSLPQGMYVLSLHSFIQYIFLSEFIWESVSFCQYKCLKE